MIPDENNRVEWFEYIVSRSMVKFKNDIANAVKQFQNNEIILKTDKNVPHGRTEKKRGVYSLTAREYLEQVLKLDRLINSKLTELSRLRHNMESLSSPVLSPDKVRSGGVNTSMSTVDKIIDLERTIDGEIDKLIDLKADIRRKINCVCNPDFITV